MYGYEEMCSHYFLVITLKTCFFQKCFAVVRMFHSVSWSESLIGYLVLRWFLAIGSMYVSG